MEFIRDKRGRWISGQGLCPRDTEAIHYLIKGETRRGAMKKAGFSKEEVDKAEAYWRRISVSKELERRLKRKQYMKEITNEMIEEAYAKIAFADYGELVEVDDAGNPRWNFLNANEMHKAALSGSQESGQPASIKVDNKDRQKALDALARIRGLFKDKVDHSGEVTLIERLHAGRARVAQDKATALTGDGVGEN